MMDISITQKELISASKAFGISEKQIIEQLKKLINKDKEK